MAFTELPLDVFCTILNSGDCCVWKPQEISSYRNTQNNQSGTNNHATFEIIEVTFFPIQMVDVNINRSSWLLSVWFYVSHCCLILRFFMKPFFPESFDTTLDSHFWLAGSVWLTLLKWDRQAYVLKHLHNHLPSDSIIGGGGVFWHALANWVTFQEFLQELPCICLHPSCPHFWPVGLQQWIN